MNIRAAKAVSNVAVVFALALLLATCFAVYRTLDEKIPYGARSFFSVNAITATTSKTDVVRSIDALAQEFDINLMKVTADPADLAGGRLIYAFVGDPERYETYLGGGTYPSFSAAVQTAVRSPDDIGTQDLRGAYASTADFETTFQIAQRLTRLGVVASVEQVDVDSLVLSIIADSALAPVIVAMMLGLLLAMGFSAVQRRKMHTIKALHGQGAARVLGSELLRLLAVLGVATATLVPFGLVLLYFYNGAHQLGAFASLVGRALLGFLVALMVIEILAFALSPRFHEIAIINGRRPLAYVGALSAVTHAIGLLLVFSVLSSSFGLLLANRAAQEQASKWEEASTVVSVSFAARSEEEYQAAMPGFGEVVRLLEAQGQAIVAYPPRVPANEIEGHGPDHGNSLVVNNAFLDRQPVFSADGERIVDLEELPDEIYLLVPSSLRDDAAELTRQYGEWAQFQREQAGGPGEQPVGITLIFTKTGQDVFTYGGSFSREQSSQLDPVIAVVPASSGVLSNSYYLSIASSSSILFSDAAHLERELAARELGKYIFSIDSTSDLALHQLNARESELRIYLFVLPLLLLVLVYAEVILASVYCEKRRHAIFLRHLHGWSFVRTHAPYLALNVAADAALLLGALFAGSLTPGLPVAGAIALVLLNAALTIFVVRLFQASFRADFIKRY